MLNAHTVDIRVCIQKFPVWVIRK